MSNETPLYKLIGKRIRTFRKDAGLTQADLAHRVGIARVSVSNLENGRQRVSLEHLVAIAQILGVELSELMPTHAELQRPRTTTAPKDQAVLRSLGVFNAG